MFLCSFSKSAVRGKMFTDYSKTISRDLNTPDLEVVRKGKIYLNISLVLLLLKAWCVCYRGGGQLYFR